MMAFAVVGFILASRPSLLAEIDSKVKAAVPADFANQILTLMDSAIASRTSVGLDRAGDGGLRRSVVDAAAAGGAAGCGTKPSC